MRSPLTQPMLLCFDCPSNQGNGLRAVCRLMVDKITTVHKTKIGARVGRLADEDIVRLNRDVLVFLGIATPASGEEPE